MLYYWPGYPSQPVRIVGWITHIMLVRQWLMSQQKGVFLNEQEGALFV